MVKLLEVQKSAKKFSDGLELKLFEIQLELNSIICILRLFEICTCKNQINIK